MNSLADLLARCDKTFNAQPEEPHVPQVSSKADTIKFIRQSLRTIVKHDRRVSDIGDQ